jgi:hypothetical protein
VVAGEQDRRQTQAPQRPQRLARRRSNRVRDDDDAPGRAVPGHRDDRGPLVPPPVRRRVQLGWNAHRPLRQQRRPPDHDGPTVDDTDDPEALLVRELLDPAQAAEPALRLPRDRPPDRVLRPGLHGPGQPQHLVGRLAGSGHDVDHRHDTRRHGARLVEHHHVDGPGLLEHLRPADEDA